MANMKDTTIILSIVALLVLLPGRATARNGSNYNLPTTGPKGIRNNNPGNIKIGPSNWQGKIPVSQNTDGVFEQFTSLQYGIRASLVLLQNYFVNGYNTVRKIINRWAPGSENPTSRYIDFVANGLGVDPDYKLGIFRSIDLAYYIFKFELGGNYISKDQIRNAWQLIL